MKTQTNIEDPMASEKRERLKNSLAYFGYGEIIDFIIGDVKMKTEEISDKGVVRKNRSAMRQLDLIKAMLK